MEPISHEDHIKVLRKRRTFSMQTYAGYAIMSSSNVKEAIGMKQMSREKNDILTEVLSK